MLAERAQEEQERIADRLDRFAHTLRRKLAEEDTDLEQALISRAEAGKSRDELAQYRRDRRSWAERLDQLPRDRERELAAVARRYADPQPHRFPVAVVFVVPTTGGRAMTRHATRARPPAVDPVRQHRDWLALVEVTGPFLSLPVLRETWPTLEPIDPAERDALRRAHGAWRDDVTDGAAPLGRVRAGRPARLGATICGGPTPRT